MAVSEQFKKLATANGRHVSCKVEIAGKTYYDDRITRFTFHDIAHPDWFTIGTACPNEFSITVMHTSEPEVHAEVRPYISFDGTEWLPLGIFYIARRYFRGKYANFVCFDKLYDLDVEFRHKYTSSTSTASNTLKYACEEAGLVFNGSCINYRIRLPEYSMTLRQVIGYIAALNCACARINRYGELVFKTYSSMPSEILSIENCFNVNCNITQAGISGLRVNTGHEILRYKENNDGLSMIDLYNPFMDQARVDAVGRQLDPLFFYGAEIEMQGLPFLEAGGFIMLKDGDALTPIVMSEIVYHYNGALTAELFSKNKNDNDTVVHKQEFEDSLAAIWDYLLSK